MTSVRSKCEFLNFPIHFWMREWIPSVFVRPLLAGEDLGLHSPQAQEEGGDQIQAFKEEEVGGVVGIYMLHVLFGGGGRKLE